jgi:hypothetical protein
MFVPRSALTELQVLGVVGAARRKPKEKHEATAVISAQSKLFGE